MKKFALIFVFLLVPLIAFSQNIKVEGVVKDEAGNPLEMANVIAFKKGTQFLQSYSITDSKGHYKLSLEE
ncbi:MAG: carboxypeptidase regulatory-like domain-containing protein, partial [Bacteroidetes bacterium]|nr:carboxypeptidase regulatory-like domain-containing protein [Bacteroidota bacterium]